jgi:hypothetical protein
MAEKPELCLRLASSGTKPCDLEQTQPDRFQDHKMSIVVVLKPINRADVLRDVDPCSRPRHPTNSLAERSCEGCMNVHCDVHVWTCLEVTQVAQGQTVNRRSCSNQESMGWNVGESDSLVLPKRARAMSLHPGIRRHLLMSQTICHRRRKSASEFSGDDLGFHVSDFIRNTVGVKKKVLSRKL